VDGVIVPVSSYRASKFSLPESDRTCVEANKKKEKKKEKTTMEKKKKQKK
jgi:hypothetical protein